MRFLLPPTLWLILLAIAPHRIGVRLLVASLMWVGVGVAPAAIAAIVLLAGWLVGVQP